jgi:serine protease Do
MEIIMHDTKSLRLNTLFIVIASSFLLLLPYIAKAESSADVELLDRSAKAFSRVVKDVKPAVVHIKVESTVEMSHEYEQFFNNPFFERFFGPQHRFQDPQQRKRQQQGAGSGFIIDKEGYILTNNHVVERADKITVTLSDNSEVEAKLIGTDPKSDVALIKIDVDYALPTVNLGDSESLEVGEWVIAIGNPFGLSQTVTVGVVSAKGRSRVGINEYENFIQTDAAINPGNSGGPLLNIHGQVVGINSALYSRTGGYMGIGFAIPINMVKSIKEQLQNNGKVTRGYLGVGIQDVDEGLAESFGLDKSGGVLITDVQEDTPASKAGIKNQDIIVKLGDIELKDTQDLRNRIAQTTPGTDIVLHLMRDGKPIELQVTIGEQPADFGNVAQAVPDENPLSSFGLVLQDLTPDLAEQLGYKGRQGLVISEVTPGSPAAVVGLKSGLLIEEVQKVPVKNLEELKLIMQQSQTKDRVLLRIRMGQNSRYIVLKNN